MWGKGVRSQLARVGSQGEGPEFLTAEYAEGAEVLQRSEFELPAGFSGFRSHGDRTSNARGRLDGRRGGNGP